MGSLVLYEAKNERKRAKNRIGPTMVYKYKMGLIEKKKKNEKRRDYITQQDSYPITRFDFFCSVEAAFFFVCLNEALVG